MPSPPSLLLALLLSAPPPARLVVLPVSNPGGCIDAQLLKREVAGRLGYDPFAEPAERIATVTLASRGAGVEARLQLTTALGSALGEQTLGSATGDCRELSEALIVALCVALDPLSLVRPHLEAAPPAPPPPPIVVAVPAPPPPAVAPAIAPSKASPPPEFEATLGVLGTYDSEPSPDLGFTVGAGVRWPFFSLGLEGRADLPAGTSVEGTAGVEATLLTGAVVPCARYLGFGACAEIALGAQEANGVGLENAQQTSSFYAAVGGRILWQPMIVRWFGLRLYADILAPLSRTPLAVTGDSQVAWTPPSVSVALGLQGVLQVP